MYIHGCAGVWQGPNTNCVAPSTGIRGVQQVLIYLKDQKNKIIHRIFKKHFLKLFLLNTLGINFRLYVYVVTCCFDRQNAIHAFIHMHVLLKLILLIKFKMTLLLFFFKLLLGYFKVITLLNKKRQRSHWRVWLGWRRCRSADDVLPVSPSLHVHGVPSRADGKTAIKTSAF